MLHRSVRLALPFLTAIAVASCSNSGSPSSPIVAGAAPTATAALPSATPSLAATPFATATPAATATPLASATPAVTATPATTAAPVTTATPVATATPLATATPAATASPLASALPTPTPLATPVATATPAVPVAVATASCGFDLAGDSRFTCSQEATNVPAFIVGGGTSFVGYRDTTDVTATDTGVVRGTVSVTNAFTQNAGVPGLPGVGLISAVRIVFSAPADIVSATGGYIDMDYTHEVYNEPSDPLASLTKFSCELYDGTTLLGSSVATVAGVTLNPGSGAAASCTAGYPTPFNYDGYYIPDQQGIVIPNVWHVGHTYTFAIDAAK